jgi:hypothetical protein
VTLGLAAWPVALFALACLGLYRATIVLPLAAAVVLAAGYSHWRRLRSASGGWRAARATAVAQARAALRASAAPIALAALIAIAGSSPGMGWDDEVYHLTLPKLYLQHGGFRPLRFSLFSHWPHATELVYGLAFMLDDYRLAKAMNALVLALLAAGVYRLCRARAPRLAAVLAVMMVLGNDVVPTWT